MGVARHLQILLVEDNPINQQVAARLLEKHGHTVVIACNGLEALATLDSRGFDLVLMDMEMPEMDGLEATAAIRQRELGTGYRLPIVALTAQATTDDRERCLQVGMDGFLTKPVQGQVLLRALDDVLAGEAPDPLSPSA